MTKITFVDYVTRICANWLNAVSDTIWDALGNAKTPEDARHFIGAVEEAPLDGEIYARTNATWVKGGGGVTIHNELTGRDANGAHPISAVTNLQATLDAKAPLAHVGATGTAHGNATIAVAGFMSAADKTKLDGIPAGAGDHGSLTGLLDDDHPQYHNNARGDARYSALGHTHDHGTLTGLADDDHPQYLNQTRGDALYAPKGSSGQMLGAAANKSIFYNNATIAENLTLPSGSNGLSGGPITISNGFTVTIEPGSVWSIV